MAATSPYIMHITKQFFIRRVSSIYTFLILRIALDCDALKSAFGIES